MAKPKPDDFAPEGGIPVVAIQRFDCVTRTERVWGASQYVSGRLGIASTCLAEGESFDRTGRKATAEEATVHMKTLGYARWLVWKRLARWPAGSEYAGSERNTLEPPPAVET